jgi:uncharacterized protein (TIGR00269 family)
MKCTRCADPAEIALRAHNASFCRPCFLFWFERRTRRQIDEELMFAPGEKLLVAVSGGKDSLALWDLLANAGYDTVGFHLELGIGDYSLNSLALCRQFAKARGLTLKVGSLPAVDLAVPDMAGATHRPPCAACGKAKRYHFDLAALEFGCNVLVTGHNLDDEAARLLGNVLRWRLDHLVRQTPVLESHHPKFVRKVKPFFMASEFEIAAYAFMRKIDYQVEECPNAAGATQLTYKRMLDDLEHESPGSKGAFVGDFLRRGRTNFPEPESRAHGGTCTNCGMPAFHELCSFCSLRREVERKRNDRYPGGDISR